MNTYTKHKKYAEKAAQKLAEQRYEMMKIAWGENKRIYLKVTTPDKDIFYTELEDFDLTMLDSWDVKDKATLQLVEMKVSEFEAIPEY